MHPRLASPTLRTRAAGSASSPTDAPSRGTPCEVLRFPRIVYYGDNRGDCVQVGVVESIGMKGRHPEAAVETLQRLRAATGAVARGHTGEAPGRPSVTGSWSIRSTARRARCRRSGSSSIRGAMSVRARRIFSRVVRFMLGQTARGLADT